jgi:hypothetical protein
LIRTISRDNPLWGAPRIHGELLKLGIDIAQSTVAKYMSRRCGPRSPGWQAFLRNHTAHIAGIDLFVVPTIGFKLLYGLVILRLERRRLVWTDVTANPTAELVRLLVERGARLDIRDTIWHATPLGWAFYGGGKAKVEMAECLRSLGAAE